MLCFQSHKLHKAISSHNDEFLSLYLLFLYSSSSLLVQPRDLHQYRTAFGLVIHFSSKS